MNEVFTARLRRWLAFDARGGLRRLQDETRTFIMKRVNVD